jgi:hypothetical protein
VDMPSSAAIAKQRAISNGVSVSRLNSGNYAVAVHDGDRRAIVELTPAEMADFMDQLARITGD